MTAGAFGSDPNLPSFPLLYVFWNIILVWKEFFCQAFFGLFVFSTALSMTFSVSLNVYIQTYTYTWNTQLIKSHFYESPSTHPHPTLQLQTLIVSCAPFWRGSGILFGIFPRGGRKHGGHCCPVLSHGKQAPKKSVSPSTLSRGAGTSFPKSKWPRERETFLINLGHRADRAWPCSWRHSGQRSSQSCCRVAGRKGWLLPLPAESY